MARSTGIKGTIIALTFHTGSDDTYVHVRLPGGEIAQRAVPPEQWATLHTGDTFIIEEETR